VGRITRCVTLSQHSGALAPGHRPHAGPPPFPIPADEEYYVRRAMTVLVATMLTAGGMAAPAAVTEILPRDLTITVTGLGPENRTCAIDAVPATGSPSCSRAATWPTAGPTCGRP
jgi:hypothetical protein